VSLIATSISVLYDEYIILLQQVSHNLKSIQKTVTQECCITITIITQQSHTDFMNWKSTEHVSVTAKTERNAKHNECQRRKWQSVVQNNCACNVKKVNILLRVQTSISCMILNHQHHCSWDLWKKTETNENSKRVAFSESHSWKCIRCDKAERSLKNRWTVFSSLCQC
jgi:hypothetical protein